MAQFFSYQGYQYFFDLLCFSILLLPCYYALSSLRARRVLMIFAGMYLVYFIAPRLACFYLCFWSLIFLLHRFAFRDEAPAAAGKDRRKLLTLLTFALVALPLVLWKRLGDNFTYPFSLYTNDLLALFSGKLWQIDLCKNLVAPLGLSFATFRAIDLLVKTSLGKLSGLKYDEVLFYGFFPPVQIAGPIIEYEEVADVAARPDPVLVLDGLLRIGLGFLKVFLLGGLLAGNAKIFAQPAGFSPGELWLRLAGYAWYFYLNFSGYSDISLGAARLFGFRLKENFDFPYFKPDIQAFWNSWHMSLSRWAQRNVFIPCGGYRRETQYAALFLTMLAIALWHNINASMAVFAIVQFSALALHRRRAGQAASPGLSEHRPATPPAGMPRLTTAGYVLLTFLTVMLCFPLIVLDLKKALVFYAALFGGVL